jgi:hypothetical protein
MRELTGGFSKFKLDFFKAICSLVAIFQQDFYAGIQGF